MEVLMQLKERFLTAVITGKLGRIDELGAIVELKEFKKYFTDIPSSYAGSFMPAATIETGRTGMTETKYLFRIRKGVYRIHPDALNLISGNHMTVSEPNISRRELSSSCSQI
jgi:hypothetical protein